MSQVGLSCTTLKRHQLEAEGLGAGLGNLVLGRGAFGTVVVGKWCGAKVRQRSNILADLNFLLKVAVKVMESDANARRKKSLESEVIAKTASSRSRSRQ